MGFDKKTFSERLRLLRRESKLTAAQLADRIGVKRQAIGHMETGLRGLSVETACDLAEEFGVSTDFLFGLVSPTPPTLPIPAWIECLLPDLAALDRHGQEAVKALVKGLAKKT